MLREKDLTQGSIIKNLIRFSLPYLLACFLQTFYGLADLFITGQFNGAATITAVSVGSQIMHMVTVVIVGLALGATVNIGHCVGSGDEKNIRKIIGNTTIIFAIFSVLLTTILILCSGGIVELLSTPEEAYADTIAYVVTCFGGIIFIVAYNVISGIFRGLGDSKTPMYFTAISGVINIGLDYVLIGGAHMGAFGAAIATVAAQGVSVVLALIYATKKISYFKLGKEHFILSYDIFKSIFKVGFPVAMQDGFIQISFMIITVIANSRGVYVAAAVGIVEKLICFMFLVPSAMMSSVSAITSQNVGAGLHDRCTKTLKYGILIGVGTGIFFAVICNIFPGGIVSLFAKSEENVIILGSQYLRTYVFDCVVAAVHFCFSGYFCAYDRSYLSFIHNVLSIVLVRIPGAYLAAVWYPDTLLPMGMAAPLGSLLSAVICYIAFLVFFKKERSSVCKK